MKSRGMISGVWWALLRKPNALPVLFASKADAEENRDHDEYLVKVRIRPESLVLLVRGERELLEANQAQEERGAVVDLKGYIPDMGCPKCGRLLEASRFVKLCKMTGGGLALRISPHCLKCCPSWPIPFVAGLRFLNSFDIHGKSITWRQRTRRGFFGPPMPMEEMELRRMLGRRSARQVLRPQPRKCRHKRTRPHISEVEKRRRGSGFIGEKGA